MRRVRAVREMAPEYVKLFVQSAGQLAVAYKRCAEARSAGTDTLLHMIMDYPDQTLRAGSIAHQKQWLAEAGARVAEVLPSIVPALAAGADAADAVLHMIMDYPDQTLRTGSITQQKQWLAEAGAQVAEALSSIMPALAQTTAGTCLLYTSPSPRD